MPRSYKVAIDHGAVLLKVKPETLRGGPARIDGWKFKNEYYFRPIQSAPPEVIYWSNRFDLWVPVANEGGGTIEVNIPTTVVERMAVEEWTRDWQQAHLALRAQKAELAWQGYGTFHPMVPVPVMPEMFFEDAEYAVSKDLPFPTPNDREDDWAMTRVTREVVITPTEWLVRVTRPDIAGGELTWRSGAPGDWDDMSSLLPIGWLSDCRMLRYALWAFENYKDPLKLFFRNESGMVTAMTMTQAVGRAETAVKRLKLLRQARKGWKRFA